MPCAIVETALPASPEPAAFTDSVSRALALYISIGRAEASGNTERWRRAAARFLDAEEALSPEELGARHGALAAQARLRREGPDA